MGTYLLQISINKYIIICIYDCSEELNIANDYNIVPIIIERDINIGRHLFKALLRNTLKNGND